MPRLRFREMRGEQLALGLGWTTNRSRRAVDALRMRLFEVGLSLLDDEDGAMSIQPAQANMVRDAERLSAAADSQWMSHRDWELVHDVVRCHEERQSRLFRDYDARDRVRIARLCVMVV